MAEAEARIKLNQLNIQLSEDLDKVRGENQQLRDQLLVLQQVSSQQQQQNKGNVKPGAKDKSPAQNTLQKPANQKGQQNMAQSPTNQKSVPTLPQPDPRIVEEMKHENERK